MKKIIMASKYRKSEQLGSDLVALGILKKPVSEYENADISNEEYSKVLIPYNDPTGKILLNNGCIEFEVVGVRHHTTTEHPDTITLMTKNIIRYAAFDAKESNNQLAEYEGSGGTIRAERGNNRWSQSHTRQWLNSLRAANSWFTTQHDYDEPPTSGNILNKNNSNGNYDNAPGFLAGFSGDVLQHFTDITNTTALCMFDEGTSETTIDKVFLPSYTEMGFGYNNGIAEGAPLYKFANGGSILKNGANSYYFMRSPKYSYSSILWVVDNEPSAWFNDAYNGTIGIAPIIVLH